MSDQLAVDDADALAALELEIIAGGQLAVTGSIPVLDLVGRDRAAHRLETSVAVYAAAGRVVVLDARSAGIVVLPPIIGTLTAVQELDLSGNQLGELPDSMRHLTELQRFSVGENHLTTVPECLGSLRKLTQLYLYGNALRAWP